MIQVECVRERDGLEALRNDFDRLSQGAAMQRLSWLLPWCEAYRASHRLNVLVARQQGRVIGILPLAETSSTIGGSTLVFLGSDKVCSDNLGILCSGTDGIEVANAFADWLHESPHCSHWDLLDLDGIRVNNEIMDQFGQRLSQLTSSVMERKPSPNCWEACLEGGMSAFQSRLTKRARRFLREANSEREAGRSCFEVAKTLDQAITFSHEIQVMHQRRWEERGIDGCFAVNEFGHFLEGAIRSMWLDPWSDPATCCADPVKLTVASNDSAASNDLAASNETQQRVVIGLLSIDGKPAAGVIAMRDRGALDLYLAGMNPELADRQPGWQLNAFAIMHAVELGCTRYNFMRGDEEYKARLGALPTAQQRWLIASARWSSQLRNKAYRTAVHVKKWWQGQKVEGVRV